MQGASKTEAATHFNYYSLLKREKEKEGQIKRRVYMTQHQQQQAVGDENSFKVFWIHNLFDCLTDSYG